MSKYRIEWGWPTPEIELGALVLKEAGGVGRLVKDLLDGIEEGPDSKPPSEYIKIIKLSE